MPAIDIDVIKKEIVPLLGDLKDAKEDIEKYVVGKKDTYEKWAKGFADGTLDEGMIKDLLQGEKDVLKAILLKHALKLKLDTEEKAKKLAVQIAMALLNYLLNRFGIPIKI